MLLLLAKVFKSDSNVKWDWVRSQSIYKIPIQILVLNRYPETSDAFIILHGREGNKVLIAASH